MSKFTRGPWIAKGREVYADVGISSIHVLIADCRFGRDEHVAETIANANLIAVAPDMYELLSTLDRLGGLGHEKHAWIKNLLFRAEGRT